MIALVGAMFVAMTPARAAEGDLLRGPFVCGVVGDDTDDKVVNAAKKKYAKISADEATLNKAVEATDNADAGVCPTGAVAGDAVQLKPMTGAASVWESVYMTNRGKAKDNMTNVLLLDNPDNPKMGGTEEARTTRPQMMMIPGIGDFSADAGDKISSTDGTGKIITFGTYDPAVDGTGGWPVTAGMAGTVTVTVIDAMATAPSVTKTYEFDVRTKPAPAVVAETPTVANPTFKIKFVGESDDIVKAGTNVRVTVTSEGGAHLTSISAQALSFYVRYMSYGPDDTNDPADEDEDPDLRVNRIGLAGPSILYSHTSFDHDDDSTSDRIEHTIAQVAAGTCIVTDDISADADEGIEAAKMGEECPTGVKIGDENTSVAYLELVVPAGTPEGAYLVTAAGTRSSSSTTPLAISKALTIGTQIEVETVNFDFSSPRRMNIPVKVAGQSATVLNPKDVDKVGGGAKGDMPNGYADDTSTKEPASISVGAGNNTELSLSLLNASGKPSEASAVSSIVISSTNGTISTDSTAYMCKSQGTHACEIDFSALKSAGEPLPATIRVLIEAPGKPGKGAVSAVVVAGGKVFTADSVEVAFYGPSTALEIGDASGTVLAYNSGNDEKADYDADKSPDKDAGASDQISFSVNATDTNGNPVRTPTLTVTIKDANGATVPEGKFDKPTQSGSLMNTLHVDVDVAKGASQLKAGTYTIEVKSGALKDSTTFMVVGLANQVEIMATEADENGQIEVTVTVTDAEGNPVADGTAVEIKTADLRGDSDPVLLRTSTSGVTKGGMAKATFIEVGYGPAAIIATADGKTDVHRVTSTFDAPVVVEAEPEEASLACLSETNGFSAWTCEVEASASEIFGWVQSRGATAIHLNSGGKWIRYSVVDGTMVPGSSNFTVTEDDILYISN